MTRLLWLSLATTTCLLAAILIALSWVGYGKPPKSRQEELEPLKPPKKETA